MKKNLWEECGDGYAALSLDEMKNTNTKWGIGAFWDHSLPQALSYYSDKIEIGFVTLGPDIDIRKHLHQETEEIYLILRGEMRIEVKGRMIRIGERELILVKANSSHRIVDFTPGTEVFLIKTPSKPGDKKIVK